MAGAVDPPETPAGRQQEQLWIHSSRSPGIWSTWEGLWEDTKQSDPLEMSWMDPCWAGILPSASRCSFPSKHGGDPRKTQSWKPLLTATTHSRFLLPLPLAVVFRELLPASRMVYCWNTQSPTSDSRHYRSFFTHFIERISLKKGNLVAWGLVGWL